MGDQEGLTKKVTSDQALKEIKGQNLNATLMAFQEFRGLFTDGYDRKCLVKCQRGGCWEFRRGS